MSNDTETITRRVASEKTEDGDLLLTWEVRVKGFDAARAWMKEADRWIEVWTACGDGWLAGRYNVLVDGAEIAIEAANDVWAQRQQDIEDAGRGCW